MIIRNIQARLNYILNLSIGIPEKLIFIFLQQVQKIVIYLGNLYNIYTRLPDQIVQITFLAKYVHKIRISSFVNQIFIALDRFDKFNFDELFGGNWLPRPFIFDEFSKFLEDSGAIVFFYITITQMLVVIFAID